MAPQGPEDAHEVIPCAVIGLSFEFPQDATTERDFWRVLCEGRSTSTPIPENRFRLGSFHIPVPGDGSSTSLRASGGHFLKENLDVFDAPFFSITPSEAACMDPQHRRMLEVTYHALENAGIPAQNCVGTDTSVYTGCFTNDYMSILQQDYETEHRHAAMGIAPSMLANRLSWFFDLRGTSLNLDSACSSSLLALHLACQDLRTGKARMSLVGGANMMYDPSFMKMMSDFNFLSPDSRSWSFDQRANGYARGEGVAVLVVKRLSDALADGDTIRAIIRNTASNQDGRTPGITQPSQEAQINLIQQVFHEARIDMKPTRFFECHGTGTVVGDPIEANAIGNAFRSSHSNDHQMYMGAVKANIGHLEGCSGLAGIIKTILVLEKGIIPPIAGFEQLNDQINAADLCLNFPKEMVVWPDCVVRRACVDSFGFGGTNAIAVLDDVQNYLRIRSLTGFHQCEDPVAFESTHHHKDMNSISSTFGSVKVDRRRRSESALPKRSLLVWSASDQTAAKSLTQAYIRYIERGFFDINSLTCTLLNRRAQYSWRSYIVAMSNMAENNGNLHVQGPFKASADPNVAFIFTGQGSQYCGMGLELMEFEVFRKSMESSDIYLKELGCTWSLCSVITAGKGEFPVNMPEFSQPLVVCLQIALTDLLTSLNVRKTLVLGHSSGEIAAAYAAAALSHFSAVKVAYHRGRLSSDLADQMGGMGMMAVGISMEKVQRYLHDLKLRHQGSLEVEIGCNNSPDNITLTGKSCQLEEVAEWLKADSIFTRALTVPVAYHSTYMNAIADKYLEVLGTLHGKENPTYTPFMSSVTGDIVPASELSNASYWVKNLTFPVEFNKALSRALLLLKKKQRPGLGSTGSAGQQASILLEVGPHSALKGPIRERLSTIQDGSQPAYIPTLIRNQSAAERILASVGELHCRGSSVDVLKANGFGNEKTCLPSDLPKYPFNHSQTHWIEGRLSKNFRFPPVPRHGLLGAPSPDWNTQVAQWRNVLRLNDLPWMQDHQIGGEIVFPAAGMVVMAIEALVQLLPDSTVIRGIQVKDVSFTHPISVDSVTQQAEIQMNLLSDPHSVSPDSWYQFRLFSIENESYVNCCDGLIRAVFEQKHHEAVIEAARMAGMGHSQVVDPIPGSNYLNSDPYEVLTRTGSKVFYGPTFKTLSKLHLGKPGEATAEINTESWRSETQTGPSPYVIHPTTLDGLAQLLLAGASSLQATLPTMVPVHASNIWVDCSEPHLKPHLLEATSQCKLLGYRGAIGNILGISTQQKKPVVYIEGLRTTFIEAMEMSQSQNQRPRELFTQIESKPALDLMTSSQVHEYCTRGRPEQSVNAAKDFSRLSAVLFSFLEEGLVFLESSSQTLPKEHLSSYVEWMKHQCTKYRQGPMQTPQWGVQELLDDEDERQAVISEIETWGAEGEFFMTLGRNLSKILRGDADPLAIMFSGGLADRYYESMLANDHHSFPAAAYVKLMCFLNPSMNILEVGAGTGGQTSCLLRAMSDGPYKKWKNYDYTDISPAFFGAAKMKFREYEGLLNFRLCDISQDPTTQSFESESYDLVIASHVLHATTDVRQALRNVRKLLRPGGKLLLFETTEPEAIHIGFAFGLLKDWWEPLKHEPRSNLSPCLNVTQWDVHLQESGFSGVDVSIAGQEAPGCRYSSIMVASATEEDSHAAVAPFSIAIVVDNRTQTQYDIACDLQPQLAQTFGSCEVFSLGNFAFTSSQKYHAIIFLLEMDASFLYDVSEQEFYQLKSILTQCNKVLWVTRTGMDSYEPKHHLANGLGRALMSEDSARVFATLSLTGADTRDDISNILETVLTKITSPGSDEVETTYHLVDGVLHTERVIHDISLDEEIAQVLRPQQSRQCQLDDDTRLSLQIRGFGEVDSCFWSVEKEPLLESALGHNEVLIQVKAIGLSSRDILALEGKIDDSSLGTECAGIILAAGPNSCFSPGDRVCVIGCSMAKTQLQAQDGAVFLIPHELSFEEAASVPNSMWMAYQSLVFLARVTSTETILVRQGADHVAQMAIQLARKLGAKVYVTTSTHRERQFLCDQFNLSEAAVFVENDLSSNTLFQATLGQGVDVILNPPSITPNSQYFLDCLSPLGRIVNIGFGLAKRGETVRTNKPSSNSSVSSVNMVDLLNTRPNAFYRVFQSAMKCFFEDHTIQLPGPLEIVGADHVQQAFENLRNNAEGQKFVIKLESGTTILANLNDRPICNFSPEATYIIVGGLGGLGRSFARWMASRGARHLVLLSRSGAKTETAKGLLDELSSQGVNVEAPVVDIGDLESLKFEIERISKTLPPIKGCIQAAIALNDNLFENMTHQQWKTSLNAKASGSWNLHETLPFDLDFFVLISSLNGIFGGRAQANYAAGNAFLDALAHYRKSQGLTAVSIDLGLVVSEGVVAENESLMKSMKRLGHLAEIHHDELIAVLEHYCDPSLALQHETNVQVLVGIEMPHTVKAKGIDLHHSIHRPLFRHMFVRSCTDSDSDALGSIDEKNTGWREEELRNATSEEAETLVTHWLSQKISQMLGNTDLTVDIERPLHTHGMDSLMAIDLKNWFAKEVAAQIEVFSIFSNISVRQLSAEAARKSGYRIKSEST